MGKICFPGVRGIKSKLLVERMVILNPTAALSLHEVMIRIGCALAAGLILGLERESHGRAAGLKTTILACVASCIAAILSEDFYRESFNQAAGMMRPDRARLAAGILTGIGFLGAGAIIRQGTLVRGVTTAAVLWFITILGLTFGSGHLELGLIGTVIAIIALFALPHMEQHIKKDFYTCVTVTLGLNGISDDEIRKRLQEAGVHIQRMTFDYDVGAQSRSLSCDVKMRRNEVYTLSRSVVEALVKCPGVTRVKWG
jgi:putative Mg2+ transporter-C (MgtC) family protein